MLAFALMAAFASGCGGGTASDGGWLRLVLEPDAGVDVSSADTIALEVTHQGAPIFAGSWPLGGEIALDQVEPGPARTFHVEMRNGAVVLAEGEAGPEDLVAGRHTTVVVVLKEPFP